MGHEEEEDTTLTLSLGSCVPPTIRSHRRTQNPISFDVSLALSVMVAENTNNNEPMTPSCWDPLSSSHSTVSSFSTVKREKDEYVEVEVERGSSSRAVSEEEEDGIARKKLRLTKEQSALLEDKFKEHSTLNPKQKQALAKQLNLRPRQVEVWFQNRRARTKVKQIEVDCEFLKRCCETLADENRRLQREVNELKAMKLAVAPLYMQLPAATLAMCPSCERVTAGGVGDAAGQKAATGRSRSSWQRRDLTSLTPFTHSAAC